MYVLSVQYSCAVVSVFLFGGKANLVLLTFFYFTVLALSGKPLQTDGQTEEQINQEEPIRVASTTRINLEEPVMVASPHRINSFLHPSVSLSVCKG